MATAEQILTEAMGLFAERGYERTSVADIQVAAGLTAGSGALYKHFPSKRAVLEAGIERHIDAAEEARGRLLGGTAAEPQEAVERLAWAVLEQFGEERDALRIVFRDLEQFPELLTKVRDRRIRPAFAEVADALRAGIKAGKVRNHDPEAVAAVILGSLVFYRILDHLVGEKPGQVDETRFVRAWVDLVTTALTTGGRRGVKRKTGAP